VNKDKYAYVVLWVNKVLVKSSCVSKIPNGRAKNKETLWNPVSVFGCSESFELTALLSRKFHLRLHCYTLVGAQATSARQQILFVGGVTLGVRDCESIVPTYQSISLRVSP